MRSILFLMSLTLAAPAFADGVAVPEQPPGRIAPPSETTWTGFYSGANVIFGQGSPTGVPDIDGQTLGLVMGYRGDFGGIVVGVEFELTNGSFDNNTGPLRHLSRLLSSGVEVGYDAGAFLPYATVGIASATFEEPVVLPNFDAVGFGTFYGIGIDYTFRDDITLGAELVHYQFNDFPLPSTDLSLNTLSLTATYRY